MNTEQKYTELSAKLEKFDQTQLLKYWPQLTDTQKKNLISQLEAIEWNNLQEWIDNYVIKAGGPIIPTDFGPAPAYSALPKNDQQTQLFDKATALGKDLISAGKVAAFVVAGGQGTRLGFDGPKGNYPTSPVKSKTLFQIFAEIILGSSKKYNATIPWYIMTSPLNHQITVDTFEQKNYFGLKKEDVFFFQQGTLPNFDFDGNILLNEKGNIATSPDGHGGSLKALYESGAIADMKKRGIEQISYYQVDNPLINIIDPLFVGLHAMEDAQMSSKALKKAYPKEKVGNFCLVDGRVNVIEYSDLPDEMAEKTNDDGSLVFEMGSIAIHLISREFVEKLNAKGFALPIHRAVKKIPFINDAGQLISPDQPNGIKLETFVFDALPLADKSIILETLRENEFAPVKNATGVDSAEVTRKMMSDRFKAWLKAADVETPDDAIIEISPLFAVDVEDVLAKKDQLPEIRSGGNYIE